jgi:hypothetical protein
MSTQRIIFDMFEYTLLTGAQVKGYESCGEKRCSASYHDEVPSKVEKSHKTCALAGCTKTTKKEGVRIN